MKLIPPLFEPLFGTVDSTIKSFTWTRFFEQLVSVNTFKELPVYANNAAAIAGGLVAGNLYRTGGNPDTVCVVH
jgi:hypothetical protein